MDPTYSAFIAGLSIFDIIMVAHEVIHVMKNKRNGNDGFVAAKLDISKAYGRIEWHYLREVLSAIGFSHSLVHKIMNCVTSVSYSLIPNGELT